MRGLIVLADIRLDLHDPADAPAGLVVADQSRIEQGPPRLQGGSDERSPIDEAQPDRG
jgi:hypothetical protein